MKKITFFIFVLTLVLSIFAFSNTIYAADTLQATIDISADKTELSPGDTVTFSLKIINIAFAADDLVTAAQGTITYDTNFFEKVTTSDATGLTINPSTGSFLADFSASGDTDIGTIKLKVKSDVTGSSDVRFSDLKATDGETFANTSNKTIKISIGNSSGGNTSGGNTSGGNTSGGNTSGGNTSGGNTSGGNTSGGNTSGGNTSGGNTSGGNTSGGNTSGGNTSGGNTIYSGNSSTTSTPTNYISSATTSDKILPYTGEVSIFFILIVISGIFGVVSYRKYRDTKSI